jgi:hypothetical protein
VTTDPADPYDALFAEIVAEWEADEDTQYRRYYPAPTNPKENNR